jgi:hypothetical protein
MKFDFLRPQKPQPQRKKYFWVVDVERWLPHHMRKFDGTFEWFEDQVDPYHRLPKHVRVSMAMAHAIVFAMAPLAPLVLVLCILMVIARILIALF